MGARACVCMCVCVAGRNLGTIGLEAVQAESKLALARYLATMCRA